MVVDPPSSAIALSSEPDPSAGAARPAGALTTAPSPFEVACEGLQLPIKKRAAATPKRYFHPVVGLLYIFSPRCVPVFAGLELSSVYEKSSEATRSTKIRSRGHGGLLSPSSRSL